ncbi:DNA ligase 3-like [Clytia hemisphaerica]
MAQKLTTDAFSSFWKLCKRLSNESSYKLKTSLIKEYITKKSDNSGKYQGNLYLLAKFLLPGKEKRIYNVKDKQLLKYFSQIFKTDLKSMTEHLEKQGVVSDTVMDFFSKSHTVKPLSKSNLTLIEVDEDLESLSKETKEDAQTAILKKISKKCTTDDLCYIVRLIKHDLRTNCGAKHFLDALDENAYEAWQASSDLKQVIEKWQANKDESSMIPGLKKTISIKATLMTPVKPMLAEACKSIEQAFKKCPNGMYSEIKYDGERVQIHKDGEKFQYFSRSLKPVQPHKIAEVKDFIPKACPQGDSLILDGEVLLMDSNTNQPLPFGTLGIHKKAKFKDATVCYVIFDILQFNDENLMKRSVQERRKILQDNVTEIPGRIVHSEMKVVTKKQELQSMLKKCFAQNLEGLVLKDIKGKYEPGKRHWLKVKKDYLQKGAMADTADLVVLGAYIGTGNKGGLMSVFLMGCYDESRGIWVTVTKCGNGHDDDTLKKLQKQLKMQKISKDFSKVPMWLDVDRGLVPDYVIADPKNSQIWEITGAEFSQSSTHTADGISIRFPRVTRIRNDKDWKTATSLKRLKVLYKESKETTDVEMPSTSTNTTKAKTEKKSPKKIKEEDQTSPAKKEKKLKRKSEESTSTLKNEVEEDSSKKKKKKDDDDDNDGTTTKQKKACTFGEKCYRTKNGEHMKEYSHEKNEVENEKDQKMKETTDKDKELCNVFTDMCFTIHKDVPKKKKIKRFIIAYDGDVVDDVEDSDVTHIITETHITEAKATTIQVQPEWVWICVKAKKLFKIDPFLLVTAS